MTINGANLSWWWRRHARFGDRRRLAKSANLNSRTSRLERCQSMGDDIARIRAAIRDIPDFPRPGIVFKDITPLLSNGPLFAKTVDLIAERYHGQKVDIVLGIESRGFIFGSALAYKLGAGFSGVRKPGKLPYETHSADYELEYGKDKLEIHVDAVPRDARVVIAD